MMHRIWAPWRKQYLQNGNNNGCFLCDIFQSDQDQHNLVLFRTPSVFVVMNKYPYTNGHLMVVPAYHTGNLDELASTIRQECFETTNRAIKWISRALKPQGYNIGMNLGKVAGAGLESHLHIHIVPRWSGDANFMTTVHQTRVISESLEDTYQRIKESIDKE